MKILYIADVKGWCFHHMGNALKKYGRFTYHIRYGRKNKYRTAFLEANEYDLVIYCVDVRPDYIIKYYVPPDKLIMLIRSDVFETCSKGRGEFYKNTELVNERVCAFFVANEYLYKKFEELYSIPVHLAPGGCDIDIFKPAKKRSWPEVPRVGWAGSCKFFGEKFRGIDKIREACGELGYIWNPAIKEDRKRSQIEMAHYYLDSIDLYIDASKSAGRQNGLLEALACGVPPVTTRTGIGGTLIDAGVALETERSSEDIKGALKRAWENKDQLSKTGPGYVAENWSWKQHVKEWENILYRYWR